MDTQSDKVQTEEFVEKVKLQLEEYISLRLELFKTTFTEKVAKSVSKLVTTLVLMVLAFFTVLFLSLVAGFYFGGLFNSLIYGFVVVALFYLLLFLIIVAFRKPLIQSPVINSIITIIYEDNEA